MKRTIALLAAATVALAAFASGDSSDGHTHAEPAAVATSAMAPRAVASTEEFEVVAVLEGRKLVLYVDRFASNEPVTKAKVEVDGAGLKGVAGEATPGLYVMHFATPLLPGRHPLTIGIEAGDVSDLLTATLDNSQRQGGAASVDWWRQWYVWISAGALLLLAISAWIVARRLKTRSFSAR